MGTLIDNDLKSIEYTLNGPNSGIAHGTILGFSAEKNGLSYCTQPGQVTCTIRGANVQ